MLFTLPFELQEYIYYFDSTYTQTYDIVMKELKYKKLQEYLEENYTNICISDCNIIEYGKRHIIKFIYKNQEQILLFTSLK